MGNYFHCRFEVSVSLYEEAGVENDQSNVQEWRNESDKSIRHFQSVQQFLLLTIIVGGLG